MSQHVVITSAYDQLKPAEKQFVDDYVDGLEKAARKAQERISLAVRRPIPPAAVEASGGMLRRIHVLNAIHARVMELAVTAELTIQRIVDELAIIAFSNLDDMISVDEVSGAPVFNFNDVTREQMGAVASIEYNESPMGGRSIKVKFWNKLDALKQLGTMHGLFGEDNEYVALQRRAERNIPVLDAGKDVSEQYANFIGA